MPTKNMGYYGLATPLEMTSQVLHHTLSDVDLIDIESSTQI
jgi:hypothetical protein